ncbi:hypothetical protein D3C85_1418930 [compost metagenome]
MAEAADLPGISSCIAPDQLVLLCFAESELPADKCNTDCHAQQIVEIRADIPFVKIIDVIDNIPVFTAEGTEILEMQIPLNPGRTGGRAVVREVLPCCIKIEQISAPAVE